MRLQPSTVLGWLTPADTVEYSLYRQNKIFEFILNTGHGTLGWTMGCGSGRAIAEIVSGRQPELDFAFTGMARTSVTRAMISTPVHVKHS